MARAITIGNGNILIGLDYSGQVRDFYFPYVGLTNHVSGASGNFVHRLGVFVDGEMSWLESGDWQTTVEYGDDTAVMYMTAVSERLGVSLSGKAAVHNEKNIFLREFTVTNRKEERREIKLFISQQFRIAESRRGDTGLYDPRVGAVLHYKGQDIFLVNGSHNDKQFSEYNIGLFGIEGKEGTYHDAFDGRLECNPVEHGSVDSVLGFGEVLAGGASYRVDYWIAVGCSVEEVHELDAHVREETPARLIASTESYWRAWLTTENRNLSPLPEHLQKLFKQSLFIIRIHTDNRGGIIASSDTDMLHHGRDTYSYVWPRDAAVIAYALDVAGYTDVTRRFYQFMADCLEPQGYLMHKYLPDGSLGSSWHPWLIAGREILPIQEDETASILFMLWKHYELHRDLEFIESIYNSFIEPAARFMCDYIESETGLPQASFDLWEEKYGTSTYTASSTYGGLMAAARFANILGKENDSRTYQAVAERLKSAIVHYLYRPELKAFAKQVLHTEDGLQYDNVIDTSSFFGPFLFGVLEDDDELITTSAKTVQEKLMVGDIGLIRYQQDNYYRQGDEASPNPWIITTLWLAQYQIATAKNFKQLEKVQEILEWVYSNASSSGALSEQMRPHSTEHLSTSPLVWSHAEYVLTVHAYCKKYRDLGGR